MGPTYPVLLAGGMADRDDVQRALYAGATAAVLGTRFLMTEESRAHPAYKQRLIEALRPEYIYRPLIVKLRQLAAERPDLAGIIADAQGSKPKRRHAHVKRRSS